MSVNVSDGSYQAPEYNPVEGIGGIHKAILNHPGFSNFSVNDFEKIYKALVFAEGIHFKEMRKVSESPYFIHPLECVFDNLEEIPFESADEVAIMLLHDVLESNPQCWKKIIVEFGVDIFFSVFLLSSLNEGDSKEILLNFDEYYTGLSNDNKGKFNQLYRKINGDNIILPNGFNTSYDCSDANDIISRYGKYLRSNCEELGEGKINREIYGLSNFFFYSILEARIKLRDTINNLKDIPNMEEIDRVNYLKRRVAKMNILQFTLKKLGMLDEISSLIDAWKKAEGGYEHFTGSYYFFNTQAIVPNAVSRLTLFPMETANNSTYAELQAA